MNISQISYGPLDGGPNAGIFAVQVELSAEGSTLSNVEALQLILEKTSRKPTFVEIKGAYLNEANSEELFGFCQTLADFKYALGVLCDGQVRPNWFTPDLIKWLAVEVEESKPWLLFQVQELRYRIGGRDWDRTKKIQEPPLPAQVPRLYLHPTYSVAIKQIFDFVLTAPHVWGIMFWEFPILVPQLWWEEVRPKEVRPTDSLPRKEDI